MLDNWSNYTFFSVIVIRERKLQTHGKDVLRNAFKKYPSLEIVVFSNVFSLLAFFSCVKRKGRKTKTYVCYKSVIIVNFLNQPSTTNIKKVVNIQQSDDVVMVEFIKRNC